ncbi:inter-alpha-trypsin inhibitor heavy chain H3-like [Haliotis rubra]|uniref:inter-alpha-trypsin inhibitor heavy chain H3-like n=1 Tax=Haliotis rubra TaxID=36100 RepID=UPI001EE51328|nr:inter-alpha-trypsin inhibitor heavy chain H3-like [Haliotis rubra]
MSPVILLALGALVVSTSAFGVNNGNGINVGGGLPGMNNGGVGNALGGGLPGMNNGINGVGGGLPGMNNGINGVGGGLPGMNNGIGGPGNGMNNGNRNPPRVRSLHVTSQIKYRFASTHISSQLANDGDLPSEAVFDVIIPSEAFISNFSLEVDGKTYTGVVREKTSSSSVRIKTRRRGQSVDSQHKIRPRNTNRFTIGVDIAPRSVATFHLTYQEVLQRRLGTYKQVTYLNLAEPVPDLRVDVAIQESRDLTYLKVLPIKNRNLVTDVDITEISAESMVTMPTKNTAYIRYQPSTATQQNASAGGLPTSVVVEYDVSRGKDAGDVLVVNGYFVHFFGPKIDNAVSKDILFILDTSSSMAIRKMLQLKLAMTAILKDLRAGDRFNILEFNTEADLWQDNQLLSVSDENVKIAVDYVSNLYSNGATNIYEALINGLEFMNQYASENRSLLIFLTDGQASTGVTGNEAILSNVRSRNIYEIPIYSLAFGDDADWSFVKTVAIQNNGVGRRIYEEADAALQITDFYKEIATPILSGVEFTYLEDAANETTVTKSSFKNLFNGSEVVVAGKLAKDDVGVLSLVVSGNNDGEIVDLKLKAGVDELIPADETERQIAFTPFEEYEGAMDPGQKASLKRKAVEMSLKYNLVTPLTSMVLIQFDGDVFEERPLQEESDATEDSYGRGGWSSRGGRDPHFMLKTAWLDDQLCFDVTGKPHDVFQIIKDPLLGLTINIQVNRDHSPGRTYIVKVAVMLDGLALTATRGDIRVNKWRYEWTDDIMHKMPQANITSQHNVRSVRVGLKGGFTATIFKHVPRNSGAGEEFLNIELDKEGKLSRNTTGLLGQFIHKRLKMKRPRRVGDKIVSKLELHTRKGVARGLAELQMRRDPVFETMSRCWEVHPGKEGFALSQKHFLVKSIKSK